MAVKASDSVTIVDMTDIKKVRTWYLTQSRTASPPTVSPTATEATMTSNGWVTTEPGVDTTKKLYTVQENIFGDGTYIWGDVSLSSSYEAAIEAYNKASAAQSVANDTNNHFWFNSTGAYVTELERADFLADPDNGGGNVLVTNDGIAVRDGTRELATFSADGQSFNNKYGFPVFSIEKLDEGNSNVYHLVKYDNSSPFSFEIPWDVYQTQDMLGKNSSWTTVMQDVPFTYEGRIVTVSSATCQSLISNNVAWLYFRYTGITEDPYMTFGNKGDGDIGRYSIRLGNGAVASGTYSMAQGMLTVASGIASHAEGYGTVASGSRSHAEGGSSKAVGDWSHAEGRSAVANGIASHAEGYNTIADGNNQLVIGSYNIADSSSYFIIGNGTSNSRSNAMSVAANGDVTARNIAPLITSGSYWRYKKYSNGTFEAWYSNSAATVTLPTSVTTGWYRNTSAYSITVPAAIATNSTSSNISILQADVHILCGLAGMCTNITAVSNNVVSYYGICPASSSSAISERPATITAYVFGTWS